MINQDYISIDVIRELQKEFHKNKKLPSVTLLEFFNKKDYEKMKKDVEKLNFKRTEDKMHFSYGKTTLPTSLRKALDNQLLKAYLSSVIGKKIKRIEGNIYSFKWKDYILLSDSTIEKPSMEIIIDFTSSHEYGYGGEVIYVDGTGEYHNILSAPNSLSLINRKKRIQKFVKYVNHYAKDNKRVILIGKILFI